MTPFLAITAKAAIYDTGVEMTNGHGHAATIVTKLRLVHTSPVSFPKNAHGSVPMQIHMEKTIGA